MAHMHDCCCSECHAEDFAYRLNVVHNMAAAMFENEADDFLPAWKVQG